MTSDDTEPAESDDDGLVINLGTFTGPERLECQEHFDATFGDLIQVVREAILPERPAEPLALKGANGRVWPDQVAQFMLWVQARRDDPEVELSDFDDLSLAEVQGAFTRGVIREGKARRTRSTRSSPESTSADSSQD